MTTRARYVFPLLYVLLGGLIGIAAIELSRGTAVAEPLVYFGSALWLGSTAYSGYLAWHTEEHSRRWRLTLVSVLGLSAVIYCGLVLWERVAGAGVAPLAVTRCSGR